MSQSLRIGVILSTTRSGRFADKAAEWFLAIARKRVDASFEVLDLRDYPLPFFDEPRGPMMVPAADPEAQRWAKKLAEFDGYVFTTAEYNHGIPAVLKNALDHVYPELNRKAASFVGYGTPAAPAPSSICDWSSPSCRSRRSNTRSTSAITSSSAC